MSDHVSLGSIYNKRCYYEIFASIHKLRSYCRYWCKFCMLFLQRVSVTSKMSVKIIDHFKKGSLRKLVTLIFNKIRKTVWWLFSLSHVEFSIFFWRDARVKMHARQSDSFFEVTHFRSEPFSKLLIFEATFLRNDQFIIANIFWLLFVSGPLMLPLWCMTC